ncbi:MAG: pyridoxamine 5'-phosphate oxidase family protein [Coriobacteriales bacterium]|jgi:uncharacterized pyridoxamine 5'-phosphate oxidase family protein|nr:pyridoxamine 5'-phosphate oxidase family protein [Coriobacteriales bacterium]
MDKVYEFLKKSGTYYLATTDGERPHNRPMGSINMFDGKLYFSTGKSKDMTKQIHANPNVEISAFIEDTWLRLSCTLVESTDPNAVDSLLESYPFLRPAYDTAKEGLLFCITNATATFFPFNRPGDPEIVKF